MSSMVTDDVTGVLYEDDPEVITAESNQSAEYKKDAKAYKQDIIWGRVAFFTYLHSIAVYGLYLAITAAQWKTIIFAILMYIVSGYGVTAGTHRLWSHRSYKASWQLRLILMIFYTMAYQFSIFDWSRNHRVHHKYVETNADPHNAKRGFFYAHIGWLLVRKHPDTTEKGKGIDLSDLYADPIVMFQDRHGILLVSIFCYVIPTLIPVYCWNETWTNAFLIAGALRHCAILHGTWCISSFGHFFGSKPYDKSICPTENLFVSTVISGEGWHNYHHVFPWDYRASEINYILNPATSFIDFFAKIGWAYDLKSVSPSMIQKRAERTGDGSYSVWGEKPVWGWGDKDLSLE